MQIKISACKDCPMYHSSFDDSFIRKAKCQHPVTKNNKINLIFKDSKGWIEVDPIPEWCPLNQEPITIIKENK